MLDKSINSSYVYSTFCNGCDGTCTFIQTTIMAINRLLTERDLMIIRHLSCCISFRDFVAIIGRTIEHPYMSVKRSLAELQSLNIVTKVERNSSSHIFYELTCIGREYVRLLPFEMEYPDKDFIIPEVDAVEIYDR